MIAPRQQVNLFETRKTMYKKSIFRTIFVGLILVYLTATAIFAQTTAFNYQGKLNDGATPANGNYQLQFRLFDTVSGGGQIGAAITDVAAAVNQGVFSVKLDFGASVFAGANRFLEIAVRRNSGESYVTLSPREQIASSPYSIRTLSAASADVATNAANADSLSGACVGCVTNNHINSVDGAKVSGTVANAMNAGNAINATNATNATNAINATSATTAVNFSGALAGDVTGNQTATTVAKLRAVPLPAPIVADNGKVLKYKNNGVDPITLEWATDNTSTGGGGVTSVTASGPLASSGGATPNISLTGVVPAANGGTGVNAAGAAGNLLRSNGTAWTSAPLQSVDVPDLGASYLKNTTTPQASANFNIGGNGIVGGTLGVGITPLPGIKLDVNGAALVRTGGSGGNIQFGAPSAETGMTIIGTNRADVRFDGSTLKLLAGPGTTPPSEINGIAINTLGNIGIGTTAPTSKLEIAAQDGLAITGFQPFLTFRDTNSTNRRSRLQATDGGFLFYPNDFIGGNATMAVRNSGNVGIGTNGPPTRLAISGGPAWTSNFWTGSLSMGNASALGWEANASGQRFGIGQSTGGLYFFRTNSAFGTTGSPANYDLAIQDDGNITQNRGKAGLVKAMIYVDPFLPADQYIVRCYNGITNSSVGNCGFSVIRNNVGNYTINFGFQVNDRFLSLTQGFTTVTGGAGFLGANAAYVGTYGSSDNTSTDSRFYLIVY